MGFTTKGLATRQRIIEGAAAHLRSNDPGVATLDDIRDVTMASKSQLFHYFPGGKEELLLEIARYESARVLEDQQPHLGALDSWAAWDRWRRALIERYRAQGPTCPLAALMSQVGSVPGAAEVASTLLESWTSEVERGIRTMQAKGQVGASLDVRSSSLGLLFRLTFPA